MIYETNLKNLLTILTAARLGGFNVKADSAALQKAWNYAYANVMDKIPEKDDDIALFKKEEFLNLLQRTAPEKIEKSGRLISYYKRILKQALKLGLLKQIYESDINNIKNKKDKIFIHLEKGNLYLFGNKIAEDLIFYGFDMESVLAYNFIFANFTKNLNEIYKELEKEGLLEEVDFIY
jgi:hypothetical protein